MSEHQYPILSITSCNLLSPSISTKASEFSCNTGGRVLFNYKLRLKDDILELNVFKGLGRHGALDLK